MKKKISIAILLIVGALILTDVSACSAQFGKIAKDVAVYIVKKLGKKVAKDMFKEGLGRLQQRVKGHPFCLFASMCPPGSPPRAVPGQDHHHLRPALPGPLTDRRIAMTGEVFPIGGVREKLIAVRRVGIKEIILPEDNRGDFEEVPEHVRKGRTIHFAAHFKHVVPLLFRESRQRQA